MKTALKVVGGLLLVGLVIALGVAYSFARGAHTKLAQMQVATSTRWMAIAPQVRADAARWKSDPLFRPRLGGDAAPVVYAHIRGGDRSGDPPAVPPALGQQLRISEGWPKTSDALDVSAIDTAWMASFAEAGFFDVEGDGSPLQNAPYRAVTEVIPHYDELTVLAKVHLTKGLIAGDARSAARDVRELARLCVQSEAMLPAMVGVALLATERLVREEAERRGQPVEEWKALSEEDVDSLRRVLWAAPAPYSLLATSPLAEETPDLGNCLALGEAVALAHYLRLYAEPELPERYARITQALEQSACRLTRARKAWKANDGVGQLPLSAGAFCGDELGERAPNCQAPSWIVRFPFVRSYMGRALAASASADWFKQYGKTP